jgi:hypothetical protein
LETWDFGFFLFVGVFVWTTWSIGSDVHELFLLRSSVNSSLIEHISQTYLIIYFLFRTVSENYVCTYM